MTPNASSTTSTGSTSTPKSSRSSRGVTHHHHTGEKIPIPDTQYDTDFWRDVDDEGVGGQRRG